MVHEKDRSSKDFEDPIRDLKGQGLAEHMQGLNYAVMTFDLRGHGANVRGPLTPQSWKMMVDDLQAAYVFLLDRHNRGELNLAQLGVLGVGEGANLVAAWAASPGGAVSSEGTDHLRPRRAGARLADERRRGAGPLEGRRRHRAAASR